LYHIRPGNKSVLHSYSAGARSEPYSVISLHRPVLPHMISNHIFYLSLTRWSFYHCNYYIFTFLCLQL